MPSDISKLLIGRSQGDRAVLTAYALPVYGEVCHRARNYPQDGRVNEGGPESNGRAHLVATRRKMRVAEARPRCVMPGEQAATP